MLAYILAIAVGLSSFALYMAAFFFPEIHRKDDFLWSGVGLFYALVLWVCAGGIRGGVLLGQTAAVSLAIVFGWQTLKLRRAIAHPEEKTDLQGFSLTEWLQTKLFNRGQQAPKLQPEVSGEEAVATVGEAAKEATVEPEPEVAAEETTEAVQEAETEAEVASVVQTEAEETPAASQEAEATTETITEEVGETPQESETEVEATTVSETLAEEEVLTEPEVETTDTEVEIPPQQGSFWGNLLAPITNLFGKSKPKSPASLTEELDAAEPETEGDLFADEFEEETLEAEATSTETDEVVEESETPEAESTEEVPETIIYPEDSATEEITPAELEEEKVIPEKAKTETLAQIQPEVESSETEEETETLAADKLESPEKEGTSPDASEPKPKKDQDLQD